MSIAIFWFRRDLRTHDNAGLYQALKNSQAVLPVFIFDTDILNKLEDKRDKRVHFIHGAITLLQEKLGQLGSSISVYRGDPLEVFKKIIG